MNSIAFPKMFQKNTTLLVANEDATKQNLSTLLRSEQGELVDDPFYGLNIKAYLFEQNNSILSDILADEIYTQLALFMPQLEIDRKSIQVINDGITVKAQFRAANKANYKTNMYSLVLFNSEEDR